MKRGAAALLIGLFATVLIALHPAGVQAQPASAALLPFKPEKSARIAVHGHLPPGTPTDASNRADGRASAIHFGRQPFVRQAPVGRWHAVLRHLPCASWHVPAKAFQDGLPVALRRMLAQRTRPVC